jgi:hypothetical protein
MRRPATPDDDASCRQEARCAGDTVREGEGGGEDVEDRSPSESGGRTPPRPPDTRMPRGQRTPPNSRT